MFAKFLAAAPLSTVAQEEAQGAALGVFFLLVYGAFIVLMIAATWKLFTKAGEPGWASIVPIYGNIVLLRLTGRPWWWLLLFFIPFVNFVVAVIHYIEIAKSYGKGAGFAMGLLFLAPVFWPILGLGSSRYVGPAARQGIPAPAMV